MNLTGREPRLARQPPSPGLSATQASVMRCRFTYEGGPSRASTNRSLTCSRQPAHPLGGRVCRSDRSPRVQEWHKCGHLGKATGTHPSWWSGLSVRALGSWPSPRVQEWHKCGHWLKATGTPLGEVRSVGPTRGGGGGRGGTSASDRLRASVAQVTASPHDCDTPTPAGRSLGRHWRRTAV